MWHMDIVSDLAPTGALRASINLGNPVLAQGSPEAPSGVTVDIARELGSRLGIPVETICFGAARDSFEAMTDGRADICFLAIDPARAETVAFTAPYAIIEGVFAVADDSPTPLSATEVDRAGVRVGVKKGSGLRPLPHPQPDPGRSWCAAPKARTVFAEQRLEVAAGIRQPVVDFVAAHPGTQVLRASVHGHPAGARHLAFTQSRDGRLLAWVSSRS